MKSRVVLVFLILTLLMLLVPEATAQCAMCKQAAASSLDKNPNSMARSLNNGILYLMAIPYVLLVVIFRKQLVALYRKWRYKEEITG